MDIHKLYQSFLDSTGISTDSRSIKTGQIFIGISGNNFDGNKYAISALKNGAVLAIVDEIHEQHELIVKVDNCLDTLQELARYHRDQFTIPVVCITGSNGKTTTKELLTAALSTKYKVHATPGNYNNHIGVPLTLLQAPGDTELMIIELGANHIGEIKDLCEIAKPNFGLITNIGNAHIEGFGSLEGVIQAKTELYKYIKRLNGLIFYNQNDPVLFYNLPNEARTKRYKNDLTFIGNRFALSFQKRESRDIYHTNLYGAYNKDNITVAYTIAAYFHVSEDKVFEAIKDYIPTMNRSQIIERDRYTLILDAYNANPSSMKASIASLAKTETTKEKVLVLGDMKELGAKTTFFHQEIVNYLGQFEWKSVYLIGDDFGQTRLNRNYHYYNDYDALADNAQTFSSNITDSICLIKASRSLKLERISQMLKD